MAPVQRDASQISVPHTSQQHEVFSLVCDDDESEWLHRNDAYRMQVTARGNAHTTGSPTQLSGNLIHLIMSFFSQTYRFHILCAHVTGVNVLIIF
jgi:hypothetical protein